jgi:hypothetical protein
MHLQDETSSDPASDSDFAGQSWHTPALPPPHPERNLLASQDLEVQFLHVPGLLPSQPSAYDPGLHVWQLISWHRVSAKEVHSSTKDSLLPHSLHLEHEVRVPFALANVPAGQRKQVPDDEPEHPER